MIIKTCEDCGKQFEVAKNGNIKFCPDCRENHYSNRKWKEQKQKVEPIETLSTASANANKLGITYGQYMALKEEERQAMNDAIDARQRNILAEGTTEDEVLPVQSLQTLDNQEIKSDAGKLRISLVPMEIVRNIAKVRMYGTDKYGDKESWKEVSVERYIDAIDRHILQFNDNPYGCDEESGLPHLWHIACNAAFLCDLMKGELHERGREIN